MVCVMFSKVDRGWRLSSKLGAEDCARWLLMETICLFRSEMSTGSMRRIGGDLLHSAAQQRLVRAGQAHFFRYETAIKTCVAQDPSQVSCQ